MNKEKTKLYSLEKYPELSPKVANWYSLFQQTRKELLLIMENLDEEALDFIVDERKVETIGTLLLHIAAVEWSWIFEDIDGLEFDEEEWKEAFALRPNVNIPQIKGKNKQFYLEKLQNVRDQVYQRFKKFKDEDLDRIIESEGYKFSIEWIFFHILEHEAMHNGQILLIRRLHSLANRDKN